MIDASLAGIGQDLSSSISPIDDPTENSFAHISAHSAKQKIVEDLICFAFRGFPSSSCSVTQCREYWSSMAPKVGQLFLGSSNLESLRAGKHVLKYFVDLYLRHFHPLWSLFRLRDFDVDALPPALYLILTATGAMYSGELGRIYGSMMLEYIFSALLTSRCLYDQTLQPSDMVFRFMLLTQIAALYFGQRRLFLRALHLGGIIISEARQAKLFDEPDKGAASVFSQDQTSSFDIFVSTETRTRIALGIFRADIFMSAVLNVRPTMSPEELNLYLPCPDEIWSDGDEDTWRDYLSRQDHNKNILYSDLARIAMDRSARLPRLSIGGHGLVLFATQESVWRFCHDPSVFSRITGNDPMDDMSEDEFDHEFSPVGGSTSETGEMGRFVTKEIRADHLGYSVNKMNDLRSDYSRTIHSLRKWKHSFVDNSAARSVHTNRDRLLSGRLLYHLSFLRLMGDVGILDLISSEEIFTQNHQAARGRVYQWSRSQNAKRAVRHALAIWSLISKESSWEYGQRAKFNILSVISLYHAAVVVWVYAGSHENSTLKLKMDSDHDLSIDKSNSQFLMLCFEELFGKMASGWSVMSSFAKSVSQMAKQQCEVTSEG